MTQLFFHSHCQQVAYVEVDSKSNNRYIHRKTFNEVAFSVVSLVMLGVINPCEKKKDEKEVQSTYHTLKMPDKLSHLCCCQLLHVSCYNLQRLLCFFSLLLETSLFGQMLFSLHLANNYLCSPFLRKIKRQHFLKVGCQLTVVYIKMLKVLFSQGSTTQLISVMAHQKGLCGHVQTKLD